MKNIFKIVKKELDKVFKFPRTLFATVLLPGLMIFIIYTIIGNAMSVEAGKTEDHISIIHVINTPESFNFAKDDAALLKIEFKEDTSENLDELKEAVRNGEIDALLFYESGFDEIILSEEKIPEVNIYFNHTETKSNVAYQKLLLLMDTQKNNLLLELGIQPNIFEATTEVIFDDVKAAGQGLAMILPVLLLTFIFAGAMSVGSDAIAGEKERGTLATLLMTPVKRNDIILGKIVSTTIIVICTAGSSFVGIIAALPSMKDMLGGIEGVNLVYGFLDYAGLFGIILLLAIFASSLLLVTSTIAKSVKEASMLAMPVYMAAIVLPMVSMFSEGKTENIVLYIVPIYNCILGFKGVLSTNIELIPYLLIVGSMIVYTVGLVLLLVRLFKNEKIIFAK